MTKFIRPETVEKFLKENENDSCVDFADGIRFACKQLLLSGEYSEGIITINQLIDYCGYLQSQMEKGGEEVNTKESCEGCKSYGFQEQHLPNKCYMCSRNFKDLWSDISGGNASPVERKTDEIRPTESSVGNEGCKCNTIRTEAKGGH